MTNRESFASVISILLVIPVDLGAQTRSEFVIAPMGVQSTIAIDTAGNMHATWWGSNVCYAIYDPAGYLLQDSVVLQQGQSHRNPRLALLDNLTAVVWEWGDYAIFNSYIRGRVYDRVATATSDICQLNDSFGDAIRGRPDLARISDTTLLVVWSGDGPETQSSGIYGQVASTSLQRIGPNVLLSDDTVQTRNNITPRLVVDRAAGLAFVFWLCGNSTGNSARFRIFDLQMHPSGSSIVVAGDTQSCVWGHSIALGPANTVLLTWSAKVDTTSDILLARYSYTGTPLAVAQKVNTTTAIDGSEAEIAADSDGTLLVAWEAAYGALSRIGAQRFASDGSKLGGEFFLSASPDSVYQIFPSVAMRRGRVYASWRRGVQIVGSIFDFISLADGVLHETDPPTTFVTLTNYPNPFNSQTTLRFTLPRPGQFSLCIYSVLGQKIQELDFGVRTAGTYTIHLNADSWPSGAYFLRLVFDGLSYTQKILLLK